MRQWKVLNNYQESDEYVVDAVAAERGEGAERVCLIKYACYELDPGPECWLPADLRAVRGARRVAGRRARGVGGGRRGRARG